MPTIRLPDGDYTLGAPRDFPKAVPPFPRVALAAAHVVADPLAEQDPWLDARIDWDRTIAFRKYLWSLGLGVAEAMDTAQRGMGLDWKVAQELIRRSLDAMRDVPGAVMASGAGTDHLFIADRTSTRHMDCSGEPLSYFRAFLHDVQNRTETAMPQAHVFSVSRLALEAQETAARIGLPAR